MGFSKFKPHLKRFIPRALTLAAVSLCLLSYQNFDPTEVLNNEIPSKSRPLIIPNFGNLQNDRKTEFEMLALTNLQSGASEKEIANAFLRNGAHYLEDFVKQNHEGGFLQNSTRKIASMEKSMTFELGGKSSDDSHQDESNASKADSTPAARVKWIDHTGISSVSVGSKVAVSCRYNHGSQDTLVNVSTPLTDQGSVSFDVHPQQSSSTLNLNLSW